MLAIVITCFAAGLVAQRLAPGSRKLAPWLDRAVIDVTLPALVLAKLPDLGLGSDLVVPVGAAWGTGALAVGAVLLAARRFRWPRSTTGALLLVTPLGNTTFLGLAMVESLLGPEELARALAYDQIGTFLLLAVYGSVIAARWGHGPGGGGWQQVVGRLVRFPPFLAVLGSFVLRAVEPPGWLGGVLADVGQLVGPLAMLAVGLRFQLVLSARARAAAAWCLAVKMGVMPAAVLLVAVVAGSLDDPAWSASVLEAGMPPMVTAGIVATQAGLDEEVATGVVGLGLLLAVVTIPVLVLLVG